ncbi:MAG: hypothetical protein ABSC08_06000 [Bryobacteraceae bacterium]|jgi:hypothetical protein
MVGGELQVIVSFSLVLGAILGALVCSYVRAGRNRLVPSEAAFQVCLELRQKLELLQQSLQADNLHTPHPIRMEALAGMASGPAPARASSGLAALCAAADFDPPVSSKDLPNVAAWRRVEKPQTLAHHVSRLPRPAETELVAPVRRRNRAAGHPGAIDAQLAQELVLRHFGVAVDPLPQPAAAGQSGKVLRMPAARIDAPARDERQSLAR